MAKKRQLKKKNYRIEIIAISTIIFAVLAFFSLGFIGKIATNSIRLIFGDTYHIVSILLLVAALSMLLRQNFLKKIPLQMTIAVIVLYVNILTLLSLTSFPNQDYLFNATVQNALGDLFSNQQLRAVGGGLIGSFIANSFVFLFSRIGSYFIIVLLCMIALFILSGKGISDIVHWFKQLKNWISNYQKNSRKVIPVNKEKRVIEKPLVVESDDDSNFIINTFTENDVSNQYEDRMVLNDSEERHQLIDISTEITEQDNIINDSESNDNKEVSDVQFNRMSENENYELPPVNLLNKIEKSDQSDEYELIKRNSRVLEETFKNFGVNIRVVSANLGPSVTKYELQPAIGVKVSKIVSLADDIALALAAKDIRIEAPIPGKSLVGIEVPNRNTSSVSFREIIENNIDSESKLEVPLGRDISGNIQIADLSKMPHLLVAGATGSGKSVAINGMITSILMKAKPNEVKLIMVDPKKVELSVYNGIPHLLTPVVTNPRRAAQALQKVVAEMERRYELFAQTGAKNIISFNQYVTSDEAIEDEFQYEKLPYIVVIVDELADLMMVASNEVEAAIIRLAQMARAAGIHMVLATQRPSVDVITGLIKANVPSRMAFAVSSSIDSRTIIDSNGAEKLLGKGDMLFMPMGENKPIRVQGAFLSEKEVERVVAFVKTQQGESYVEDMMPTGDLSHSNDIGGNDSDDDLLPDVLEFLKEQEFISVSMLQRRFRVGFNRAARLMETLEAKGVVGPAEGTKPRKVFPQN